MGHFRKLNKDFFEVKDGKSKASYVFKFADLANITYDPAELTATLKVIQPKGEMTVTIVGVRRKEIAVAFAE